MTVRGPYATPPDSKHIEQWSDRLHGHGVLIADVGIFSTPHGHAVFLHAKSKLFDEVWWKPDFSGPARRRIPHVTIYETPSREKANAVANFLRSEAVEIVTYSVELTVYTSKQQTLIRPEESVSITQRRLPPERVVFRDGLFERAQKLHVYLKRGSNNGGSQPPLF